MNRYVSPRSAWSSLEQVDDLGLDGHVQGADGLVAHDQLRLHGERPGDADALALAAAELVRVALHEPRVEAHQRQQLGDALRGGLARGEAVDAQRLGEDVAHRLPRVEARVRVLEHHLEQASPPTQLARP